MWYNYALKASHFMLFIFLSVFIAETIDVAYKATS